MQMMRLNLQMFASGTISETSAPSNGDIRITWSSTQNEEANTSSVTATVQVKRASSGTTNGTFKGSVSIDGVSKSITSGLTSWTNSWKTVGSYTRTISHNSDGTKSISISSTLTQSGTSLEGTYKASGTVALDTIDRGSTLSEIEEFGLTDTIEISITKYVETFTDNLVISSGTTTIKTINNISNGYSLTFTTAEQNTIKGLMTSPKIELTFTLTSKNGTTTIGTSIRKAKVASLEMPVAYNIDKKSNEHYQIAINGLIDPNNSSPLQVYDDDGNLIIGTTKWIDITPSRGTWVEFKYRKVNNTVEIYGRASSLTASSSSVTIGSIPSEFAPSSTRYCYGYTAGRRMAKFNIDLNGVINLDWCINLSNGSDYITANWYHFYLDYNLD